MRLSILLICALDLVAVSAWIPANDAASAKWHNRVRSIRGAAAADSDPPAADAATASAAAVASSHPVLRQVYSALVAHRERYGHPNIPLGGAEGRQCETLRRLHVQGKLPADAVALLTDLGFRWHNLEDIYGTSDFGELYQRLVNYRQAQGAASPPKKYPADPELGAWVTGIRRLGRARVAPEHVDWLDAIGFQWTSPRQCGSSFMEQYREVQARLANEGEVVWSKDVKLQAWVKAQQEACRKGKLSETRKHYLETLLGEEWVDWSVP